MCGPNPLPYTTDLLLVTKNILSHLNLFGLTVHDMLTKISLILIRQASRLDTPLRQLSSW